MKFTKFIYTLLCPFYALSASATATLYIEDAEDGMEEGRTYKVRYEYIQTEGVDDFGDIAYNPTFFSDCKLKDGESFSCSFRSGAATAKVSRPDGQSLLIETNKGKVSFTSATGQHRIAIGLRDEKMCFWIDADTSAAPSFQIKGFETKEGLVSYTASGKDVLSNTKVHYDYAYGLQFKIDVPEGSNISDIEKTNDQRVVFNYKRSTLPPLLYLSSLSPDGKYLSCDLNPTPLNKPIPFGTKYTFEWKERVSKCPPALINRVSVKLYKHKENSIITEVACPCGENTCELDTVFISTDSYCTGKPATLTANVNINGRDCLAQWKMNSMVIDKKDGSNELTVERDGIYQVTVTDKNDATCVVTSPEFNLKRYIAPKVSLDANIATQSSTTLAPKVTNNAKDFTYEWSTGETTKNIRVTEPGRYNLTVSNGLCTTKVSTLVEFSFCDDCIPSVLTPNGDGINDRFEVDFLKEKYPNATISIYDRNGKILTKFLGSDAGWDGTYLGEPMPSTDYWYKIDIENIDRTFYGHFTLMRDRK